MPRVKKTHKQMAKELAEALRTAIVVIHSKEEMIRSMGGSSATSAMFKRVLREYDKNFTHKTESVLKKTERHHRDDCHCSECHSGSYR